MKVQGQRSGDNGDQYERKRLDSVEKQLEEIQKEHKKKRNWQVGLGSGTVGGLVYALQLVFGQPGDKANTPANTDVVENAKDTRSNMWENRKDLKEHVGDYKIHVALQDQWQKNMAEKFLENQRLQTERYNKIMDELKYLRENK